MSRESRSSIPPILLFRIVRPELTRWWLRWFPLWLVIALAPEAIFYLFLAPSSSLYLKINLTTYLRQSLEFIETIGISVRAPLFLLLWVSSSRHFTARVASITEQNALPLSNTHAFLFFLSILNGAALQLPVCLGQSLEYFATGSWYGIALVSHTASFLVYLLLTIQNYVSVLLPGLLLLPLAIFDYPNRTVYGLLTLIIVAQNSLIFVDAHQLVAPLFQDLGSLGFFLLVTLVPSSLGLLVFSYTWMHFQHRNRIRALWTYAFFAVSMFSRFFCSTLIPLFDSSLGSQWKLVFRFTANLSNMCTLLPFNLSFVFQQTGDPVPVIYLYDYPVGVSRLLVWDLSWMLVTDVLLIASYVAILWRVYRAPTMNSQPLRNS